jgi:hypothetical protein
MISPLMQVERVLLTRILALMMLVEDNRASEVGGKFDRKMKGCYGSLFHV